MSGIGTNIDLNISSNFDFLQNLKENQKLKIKVELGYLNIPRRQTYPAAYVTESAINNNYPNPGGIQGESFYRNKYLRQLKSSTLRPTVNGLAPPHMELVGAPWCTFLEGTIMPSEVHPYYNLVKGPADAPIIQSNSTLEYNSAEPVILKQESEALNDPEMLTFNKLGKPFIPATTKTSSAITNLKLQPITTYNIWSVDNIGSENYNFEKYLGYVPKNSALVSKLQPYAQTWSYANNSQIQVYASNSQVKLTRLYPIYKDYAHQPESKYCIYDSATTDTPQVLVKPIGLSRGTPVGFTIKFSNIVTTNSLPAQVNIGTASLAVDPKIVISWGDVSANQKSLDEYTSRFTIGKYTLVMAPGVNPSIYFNIASENIGNDLYNANQFKIDLKSLSPIQPSNQATSDKTDNSYSLYVYYTGEYLKIGNSKNPGEWEVIRSQEFFVTGFEEETEVVGPGLIGVSRRAKPNLTVKLNHYLDTQSRINIQAQFCNFVFSYGPPLFEPQDDQNIPAIAGSTQTPNIANTNNFITGNIPYGTSKPSPDTVKNEIINFIQENSVNTFEIITDNDSRAYGGAATYLDARASDNNFEVVVEDLEEISSLAFKITLPNHLGATIFNKFLPVNYEDPEISESYAKYDLTASESNTPNSANISSLLTQSVQSLSINKTLNGNRIESELEITFLNLNRSDVGLKILNFMRRNVCVLRVSAGYDYLYPYFEGMVGDIDADESLEKTTITVKAKDLLDRLFVNEKTQILPTVNMQFPGMTFRNIIGHLHTYTELYHHFAYDLGDNAPGTIFYKLLNCPTAGLPKVIDTSMSPTLAKFVIGAYSTSKNFYQCLEGIATLLVQTNKNLLNTSAPCSSNRFDIPVYYWYTDGKNDGIVMTSRTLKKDRDTFYIRRSNITELMTKDISLLHGYLRNTDSGAFSSESNSDNLFARGFYRGIDIDGYNIFVQYLNNKAVTLTKPSLEQFDGFVGYDKIVIFDKEGSNLLTTTTIGNNILSKKYAENWINTAFDVAYKTVYETINLQAFVTKPLKEWGNFGVCVESDDVEIPETFLYNNISYEFDLDKNLISAKVSGQKQPAQNY